MDSTRKERNKHQVVQPLLNDLYQFNMCYAYWFNGSHNNQAVFELYFRKNPFKGEFTIFAGLEECLKFIEDFSFCQEDIEYLKNIPNYCNVKKEFWDFLLQLDTSLIKVHALDEGIVSFPNIPLIRIEGPIAILQLLETPLLTLTNYASLMTTNAARYRLAVASIKCRMVEFGLRRAQGPDGGLSASRYAYMGGFDATSNLLAGKKFNIPVSGTFGHSYVLHCYCKSSDNKMDQKMLENKNSRQLENFTLKCLSIEEDLVKNFYPKNQDLDKPNLVARSELVAFIAYAVAYPDCFTALIDTYDPLKNGLLNFCIVALALIDFGYKPIGVRIDSGDLAYLSICTKKLFTRLSKFYNKPLFESLDIIVSNDINEETIISLNDQEHYITCIGVGTHLVTCQNQPALGCVYKLVEINGAPCMKQSATPEKSTMPGRKLAYRLFGRDGKAILDLMALESESPPRVGERILCYHPFVPEKRTYVTPSEVMPLLKLRWDGRLKLPIPGVENGRVTCKQSLDYLTKDIKRTLNPTPYKVSITAKLREIFNELKLELTPVGELM